MHTNAQAGALSCFIIACMYILCKIVELIWPADAIEDCPHLLLKHQMVPPSQHSSSSNTVRAVGSSGVTRSDSSPGMLSAATATSVFRDMEK